MSQRRACLLILLLLLACLSELFAQTPKGEKTELLKHRLSRIRGMRVENEDGEKLGDASNFIINVSSGEVVYCLIQPHGLAVLGTPLKIVPVSKISSATIKKGVLLLDVGPSQWKHAPTFKKGDLANVANPIQRSEIASYYGIPSDHSRFAPTGPGTRSSPRKQSKPAPGDFRLATELLGTKVYDTQNALLGVVSDLLIDLSEQRLPLVIVSGKRLFTTRSSFVANLSAFSTRGNKLVIEAVPAKVEHAPFLTLRDWKTASIDDPMIYRMTE